jgi:hypothetical protein
MDRALRHARLCYDHLAGEVGVALTSRLVEGGYVAIGVEAAEITPAGHDLLSGFGVDLASARKQRRNYCKGCLDWTEKRSHLAGAVGAALAKRLLGMGWIERRPQGRTLTVTSTGYEGLRREFSLEFEVAVPASSRD